MAKSAKPMASRERAPVAPAVAPPRASAVEDAAAAFAEAMRGVKGLGGPKRVHPTATVTGPRGSTGGATVGGHHRRVQATHPTPPGPVRVGSVADAADTADTGTFGDEDAETAETWHWRAAGVDARLLRRLRGGDCPIEVRLDLHGLTRGRASEALERALVAARAHGRRGLLVIHGRGLHSGPEGPTLATLVRRTLARGPLAAAVLAAVVAPPALGGAGATLVWLRKA